MAAVGLRPADAHPDLTAAADRPTGLPALIPRSPNARRSPRHGPTCRDRALGDRRRQLLPVLDRRRGPARPRALVPEPEVESEDPRPGSAAGPLLLYAYDHLGLEHLEIDQGVEMGRPSRLIADIEDGRVRVGDR